MILDSKTKLNQMSSAELDKRQTFWSNVKDVGNGLMKSCIGFGLAGGGVGLVMGLAKASVTIACIIGASIPVAVGFATLIVGVVGASRVEEAIKLKPKPSPVAPVKEPKPTVAPTVAAAPDLGEEFRRGVSNDVEAMKTLRLKPHAQKQDVTP